MFKTAATKIAHNSTLPSLGGNKDLRPLQDLITAEKSVLVSLQRLSIDLTKASEALKVWGQGEGEDLGDTLGTSTAILAHFSAALAQYASHEYVVRDHMKSVRTREEALDDLKRRRKSVATKADAAERKLNKMSPEHKNLAVQTDTLNQLRDQMRSMDAEIMGEEAGLSDFKRTSARGWMALKFGGLLECSEKGAIVGDIGKQVVAEIPQEETQPGLPRSFYTGHARTEFLAAEAHRTVNEVVFSPESQPTDHQRQPQSPSDSANMPEPAPYVSNYLSAPQTGGTGLGLGQMLNTSEASAINQVDHGAAAGWDSQRQPSPPMPQPQIQARGASSVDDFGVGLDGSSTSSGPLNPRLGVRPGGAGRFATFPVKGRSQSISQQSPDGDVLTGRTSVDDPVPEYTIIDQDVAGAMGASPGGSSHQPPGPPPGAAPALANPWTESNGPPRLQIQRDGDQESGENGSSQLAYMSEGGGRGQRVSRHVRFGEDETIGHGVGVVDTPTPTTESSFRGTSTSPTVAVGGGFGGDRQPYDEGHTQVQRQQQQPSPLTVPESRPPPATVPSSSSHRVPPPSFDDRLDNPPPEDYVSDEKALNAAAAREVSREMDALSFSPPVPGPPSPRLDTGPPSPVAAPSSPQYDRSPPIPPPVPAAVPPPPQIPITTVHPQPQSQRRLSSSPQAPLAPPPALSLPTRSISPLTPGSSPYRTPPEYPRMNKSSSSLAGGSSPTLPPVPQGARTISAAAFRRRAPSADSGGGAAGMPMGKRMPSSEAGVGIADVSPLMLKKRTLPSSPYPQRPSAPPSSSASSALPPVLANETTVAPAEDEDFDYLSAYVDGGSDSGVSGSPRAGDYGSLGQVKVTNGGGEGGYARGRFATNLEGDGEGLR